jgi:hypothetical protein
MAYCLQERYRSGVSNEDDFSLRITQEPRFQWHGGIMVVCVAQSGRNRVFWVDDIGLGIDSRSSICMLCLMRRLWCCFSRSIPASATSWCVRGRLGLSILGSRERARVALVLALAIRTRQRTVAFDLACFAQITCCRDAIESSPFLRPGGVHVQIQRVRRVTEMEVDGRKRRKASDESLQRAADGTRLGCSGIERNLAAHQLFVLATQC